MSLSLTLSALGFFALASTAFASNGRLIPSPTENLFVPYGFDDNDNAEVVVHGHFKNSCYKVGPTDVKVDASSKTIKVTPQSYEYTNAICAQMMVPFIQTIKLGILEPGSYRIVIDNNQAIPPQQLSIVTRHVESPDDFIYAPVEDANLEIGQTTEDQSLVVQGRYPMTIIGCAMMRHVMVKQTPGNVLVVQPVMDLLTDNSECRTRGWTPRFSIKVPLDQPVAKGDNLIHVRVTNGNSYNKVVEVAD